MTTEKQFNFKVHPSVANIMSEKCDSLNIKPQAIVHATSATYSAVMKWLRGESLPRESYHKAICDTLSIRFSRFKRSYKADSARRKHHEVDDGVTIMHAETRPDLVAKTCVDDVVALACMVSQLSTKEREQMDMIVNAIKANKS